MGEKKAMIETDHPVLSISRQCEPVSLSRPVFYYQPAKADEQNLRLMEEIDRLYLKCPFYGSRRMAQERKGRGYEVNRKRIKSSTSSWAYRLLDQNLTPAKPCRATRFTLTCLGT